MIGVHSPEYAFEKEVDNVRGGVERLGITYPVAVDSNLTTWTNFNNHYWPAHYLADAQGNVRQTHVGEGGEATTEKHVRELLKQANPSVSLPAPVFSDADATRREQPRTPRPTWARSGPPALPRAPCRRGSTPSPSPPASRPTPSPWMARGGLSGSPSLRSRAKAVCACPTAVSRSTSSSLERVI